MKIMSLREVQLFSLEILKDVHTFCEEHSIRYSIAYGTLIGAIRHKGFIPWDDDIDIVMPRPDYERFCQDYTSDRFYISNPKRDPLCCIPFSRVYDKDRTSVFSRVPWHKEDSGLWIDIFPLEGVTEGLDELKVKYEKVCTILDKSNRQRYGMRHLAISEPIKLNVITLIRKCFTLNGRESHKYALELDNLIENSHFDNSEHFVQLACPDDGLMDMHPVRLFSNVSLVPFEDTVVRAFLDSDTYLKKIYGDYMELPPVEKRYPKQSSYLKFFWK